MWYKYVDRVGYDTIRLFRYFHAYLDAPISSSTRTKTDFSATKIQASSMSIFTALPEVREQYIICKAA